MLDGVTVAVDLMVVLERAFFCDMEVCSLNRSVSSPESRMDSYGT